MKYVRAYDELFDEMFQFEIDDESAKKLDLGMVRIQDTPWLDLFVTSRYRSERHPDWKPE